MTEAAATEGMRHIEKAQKQLPSTTGAAVGTLEFLTGLLLVVRPEAPSGFQTAAGFRSFLRWRDTVAAIVLHLLARRAKVRVE